MCHNERECASLSSAVKSRALLLSLSSIFSLGRCLLAVSMLITDISSNRLRVSNHVLFA